MIAMYFRPISSILVATAAVAIVPDIAAAATFRTLDGSGNNLTNPHWGAADTQLLRMTDPAYADGVWMPRGGDPSSLPSPRAVSNAVASQSGSIFNSRNASDWLWQWGQFIDHDLDLTETHAPGEAFNVLVPTGDPYFDPYSTGTATIGLNRSIYDATTGTGMGNPRQQMNQITSYIDASMVYGSDPVRANTLRTLDGSGKLKTSDGNLLMFNTAGLPNAGGTGANFFLAGDVRANEQIGLTATHTLFVREHNRLADEIAADPHVAQKAADAGMNVDEYIYQKARSIVGAQIQVITYNEFLPMLLGDGALGTYMGYDATVNAGIANEFSTAAFRVGHTMLSPQLQRINNDGTSPGSIALRNSFFNPDAIVENGVDSLLLGLASQKAQEVDTHIVDDVRNFLFGPPGAGGFDLASLNLQRGRDHGLPAYNQMRVALGLGAATSFADITSNMAVQNALASVYDSVDDVDLWIGGLAEDHVNGGMVGGIFHSIIADQFGRLRSGDRFFYLNDPNVADWLPQIETTRLSDIIRRNSSITNIQDNAFLVTSNQTDVPEPSVMLGALLAGGIGARMKRRSKGKGDRQMTP
ncbi:MAG TPA: peroxiredoxin [Oscillatoriales cyanobacterium M59_W2019_021]|nr:peroxiredoxin [Oscillatoriales cyanobacterium M4454_W2019_049]HIK50799.1 peroxiredoxin [Oscillatoriales cyanobacterium M59_W2019_021]